MKDYKFWQELFGADFLQKLCANRKEVAGYFQGVTHGGVRERTCDAVRNAAYDVKHSAIRDRKCEEVRQRIETCNTQTSFFVKNFMRKMAPAFGKFYEPYVQAGYEMVKFSGACEDVCTESFMEDCLKSLLSELENLGIRVLLKEMHEKREDAKNNSLYDSRTDLSNVQGMDYYGVFCEHCLGETAYREKIVKKYPVLENALIDCVYRNIKFYVELLQRIKKDKEQIQRMILQGRTFRYLVGIEGTGGDAHFSGKRVLKLKLDTGDEVVYKPHDIKNERVFYEIVYDIGLACGTDMYVPGMLECEAYGWMECVKAETCKHLEELRRYHYRMGVQLFVAYLLGTHDIHCENLIAKGEYPVIIDLENLLLGEKGERTSGQENGEEHVCQGVSKEGMRNSVLSSGMLPYGYWQMRGKCVDLSAISGGEEKIPLQVPVIKEVGTQNMHVGYRHAQIRKTSNKVTLNQNEVAPDAYEMELRQGFEIAYWYSMAFKREVYKALDVLREITCRYLVCDTQKYSLLLSSSYHPSVMESMEDRWLLLHVLWRDKNFKDEVDGQIVDAEIYDLLQNDIPFFYFQSNQTSLFDSRHREIKGYFAKSPLEGVYDRLEYLNVPDLRRQTDLIHLALRANGWEIPDEKASRDEESDEEDLCRDLGRMLEKTSDYSMREKVKMAERIADRLLSQAWKDEHGLHWNCLLVSGQKKALIRLYPCGMYLYDGISGYAVFLHMLSVYTGHVMPEKYAEVCETLDQQMFYYTNQGLEELANLQTGRTGLYNGEASLVYAYLIFYQLHGEEIYLEYAKKHARLLVKLAEKDDSDDLLDGKAGAIYALCILCQVSGDGQVLHVAERISNLTISHAECIEGGIGWKNAEKSIVLAGMAHGTAGILVALAKLYELTKKDELYDAMRQALRWEHAQFDEVTKDWKDYRRIQVAQETEQVSAWCHGAGGILLSRILISKVEWKEPERAMIEKDIERASSYLSGHVLRNEKCLCHGVCGNRLIMRLWEDKNDLGEDQGDGKILTKEWFNPSLMNGYAGIGYYLLSELEGFVDYVFLDKWPKI